MNAPMIVTPMRQIAQAVAMVSDVSLEEMRGPRRTKSIARARHTAFWLTRKLTSRSQMEIARFYLVDHSTVCNGCKRIDQLRKTDAEVERIISTVSQTSFLGSAMPGQVDGALQEDMAEIAQHLDAVTRALERLKFRLAQHV